MVYLCLPWSTLLWYLSRSQIVSLLCLCRRDAHLVKFISIWFLIGCCKSLRFLVLTLDQFFFKLFQGKTDGRLKSFLADFQVGRHFLSQNSVHPQLINVIEIRQALKLNFIRCLCSMKCERTPGYEITVILTFPQSRTCVGLLSDSEPSTRIVTALDLTGKKAQYFL